MTEKQMTPSTKTHRKHARKNPVPSSTEHPRVILVGTYRPGQLEGWTGWYCWPLDRENTGRKGRKDRKKTDDAQSGNHADANQYAALKQVSELWLFLGTAKQRTYRAEFVGVKTREELVRDYGYPAKGKPHGTRYALFKTEFIYDPEKSGLADKLIVRTSDFANNSPEIAKQLKDYLESPDRRNPALAKYLPEIVTTTSSEHLCVCEEAEQLEFLRELGYVVDATSANLDAKKDGKFTCLDFFAGSGLVSAAMARQFETVWANDISPKKAMVFNANIKNNVLDVRPIETVSGRELPSVNLSWGSFPCQDLSLAGDMNGLYASRSGLFWQWLRVMDEMRERPAVVVAENVVGLVSVDDGKYYVAAHEELAKRGYNVGAVMLDAVYWVPQSRKRIFIVATEKDVDISPFVVDGPDWCHPEPVVNVSRKVTSWVWWKLPKPPNRSINIADIIEFDAPCDDSREQQAKLRLVSDEKLKLIRSQSRTALKVFTGYRRTRNHRQVLEVRTDGIAGCLRTPCGGSSRQIVLIAENGNIKTRLLTVRETARLMGAPDSFKLPGSYNDGYMAMGDGVAFPVAKYLSENLLAPISKLAQ